MKARPLPHPTSRGRGEGELCVSLKQADYIPVGVAVDARWGTVGGPTGVCNANVCVKDLCEIWLLNLDELLELCDLADLLECKDLVSLVSVDCQTS